MTKEQIQQLEKYYPQLKSARYNKCIVTAQVHLLRIFEIVYGTDWRSHVSPQVLSCGKCKIDELSKICDMYENAYHENAYHENSIEAAKKPKKTNKNVKRNSKKTSA